MKRLKEKYWKGMCTHISVLVDARNDNRKGRKCYRMRNYDRWRKVTTNKRLCIFVYLGSLLTKDDNQEHDNERKLKVRNQVKWAVAFLWHTACSEKRAWNSIYVKCQKRKLLKDDFIRKPIWIDINILHLFDKQGPYHEKKTNKNT